jgi:drug/metabolite transporter (DMT)-like permease
VLDAAWNLGDLLTFIAALAAALHIIFVGRVSRQVDSPMAMNAWQSLVCALVTGAVYLALGEAPAVYDIQGVVGLLYLVVASTVMAFMLQIRAQQVLSPSTASLLFLLESPFAAVFGFIFLSEVLSLYQWVGAGLILAAAFLSVRRQL